MNVVMISSASSSGTSADKAMILASLSFLVYFASCLFDTLAHLIPFTLLQAMDIPIPEPQIAIPKSVFPFATASPNDIPKSG